MKVKHTLVPKYEKKCFECVNNPTYYYAHSCRSHLFLCCSLFSQAVSTQYAHYICFLLVMVRYWWRAGGNSNNALKMNY